jgi:L-ascorbate metabolism protein UlaG (beta-lactamase superfamily)
MTQRLSLPGASAPDLGEGSVVFVDAGTAVLRHGGFSIVCEPRFLQHRDHVHLGYGLGPAPPAGGAPVAEELPVDFALLSQLHADHAELRLRREIARDLPVLTTLQAAQALRQMGFGAARGLSTWQTVTLERAGVSVQVTSVPGHHRAVPVEFFLPDVMGSVLEFGPPATHPIRVYVSGDALEDLRDIPGRHPGLHLALFHLQHTRVLAVARTDAAGRSATLDLVAPRATPASGENGRDVLVSLLEDLAAAAREAGVHARVCSLALGEPYVFRVPELRALPTLARHTRPLRTTETRDLELGSSASEAPV